MEGSEQARKIREANMRLPEHQREALALRELDGRSYEEIATIMETNRGAVAQLISRARINLHDELRGNVLASVAAPSPECERALPLIAMRDDGQLDAASGDATWLDAHLSGCGRCRLGVEVMREAASSYRALSRAGTWKGTAPAGTEGRWARRFAPLAVGLAALLLLAGVATAVIAGDDPPATPVDTTAGSAPGPGAAASKPSKGGKKKKNAEKKTTKKTRAAVAGGSEGGATAAPISTPVQAAPEDDPSGEPASSPSRPQGNAAVEPTQRTSAPKPSSQSAPAPEPLPTSPPTPAPVTTVEEPPPSEDSPGKSKGHEPPGKPASRPPK
jgi:Sigma-70, region 4